MLRRIPFPVKWCICDSWSWLGRSIGSGVRCRTLSASYPSSMHSRSTSTCISRASTPRRRPVQMMGVFAEFERAMIQERVRAGLKRAKAEGCVGIRSPRDNTFDIVVSPQLVEAGKNIRALSPQPRHHVRRNMFMLSSSEYAACTTSPPQRWQRDLPSFGIKGATMRINSRVGRLSWSFGVMLVLHQFGQVAEGLRRLRLRSFRSHWRMSLTNALGEAPRRQCVRTGWVA